MNVIKSDFHDIVLIQYGVIEPNNGRMLWEVDLKINGELVTEKYFGNYPHTDIGQHNQPDSPDGRYFFIAREGGGFVLDTQRDFAAIYIRCKGQSASSFRGNLYFGKWLILVHNHEVILFDQLTQTQSSLDFPDKYILWVNPVSEHELEISYTLSTYPNQTSMLVVV